MDGNIEWVPGVWSLNVAEVTMNLVSPPLTDTSRVTLHNIHTSDLLQLDHSLLLLAKL